MKDSKIHKNNSRIFKNQTGFYLVHYNPIKNPLTALINVHTEEIHNHNLLY